MVQFGYLVALLVAVGNNATPAMADEEDEPPKTNVEFDKKKYDKFQKLKRIAKNEDLDIKWLTKDKKRNWKKEAEPQWTEEHEELFGPQTQEEKNQCGTCAEDERCVLVSGGDFPWGPKVGSTTQISYFSEKKFDCLKSCKKVCTQQFLRVRLGLFVVLMVVCIIDS